VVGAVAVGTDAPHLELVDHRLLDHERIPARAAPTSTACSWIRTTWCGDAGRCPPTSVRAERWDSEALARPFHPSEQRLSGRRRLTTRYRNARRGQRLRLPSADARSGRPSERDSSALAHYRNARQGAGSVRAFRELAGNVRACPRPSLRSTGEAQDRPWCASTASSTPGSPGELVRPALERHHDVLAVTLAGHAGGPPIEGEIIDAVLADAVERTMDEAGFEIGHVVGNPLGAMSGFSSPCAVGRGRPGRSPRPAAGPWARPPDDRRGELLCGVGPD